MNRRFVRFALSLGLLVLMMAPGIVRAQDGASGDGDEAERQRLAETLVEIQQGTEEELFAIVGEHIAGSLEGVDEGMREEMEAVFRDIQPVMVESIQKALQVAIDTYAEELTVEELNEIIRFHRTPVGSRFVEVQQAMQARMLDSTLLGGSHESFAQNLTETAGKSAQKQTVADLRNVGTAMMSWLVDVVDGAGGDLDLGSEREMVALIESNEEVGSYPRISHAQLTEILVPLYLQAVPEEDGWGNPYEFFLRTESLIAVTNVMAIRSAGRDGKFDEELYKPGAFDPEDYDQDIVWIDGYFARWPQRRQ